ncbi:hypothetical protein IPZ70_15775 [Streptomyces polychromogenes]|nr:hypothetical protein [Streptomyces polychromogenes]
MSPQDRTAVRRPSTGELAKADRRGLLETARQTLQRTVRTAAALAENDTDFLERLRDAGLRVRERHGEDGTLLGYAVALPGDRADHGTRPVWFSGSALAYDLSLPRVRERYEPAVGPADWSQAERLVREAAAALARSGRAEGAGDVATLGDLLATAAAHAPATVRDRIAAAADAFEQADRAPGERSLEGRARAGWRASARALERAPRTARGGGAVVVLTLLVALVEAVEAARLWHEAQAHRAQAKTAADAGRLLREAAAAAGAPASRPGPARPGPRSARVTDGGPWPDRARCRYRCAALCSRTASEEADGEDVLSGWSTDEDADALAALTAGEFGASLGRLTTPGTVPLAVLDRVRLVEQFRSGSGHLRVTLAWPAGLRGTAAPSGGVAHHAVLHAGAGAGCPCVRHACGGVTAVSWCPYHGPAEGRVAENHIEGGVYCTIQALINRAHDLGHIDQARRESLYKQLAARGWRTNEP